jgi:hypothetical protein
MPRVDLPPTVQKLFFDFHWDRQRLWEEAGRVTSDFLPLSDLLWSLDLPIWPRFEGQKVYDLAPSEFLREPKLFPTHMERVLKSDPSFPVILMPNLSERWVVIDGYHRLVKCRLEAISRVQVKRLDRSVIPRIRVERTN